MWVKVLKIASQLHSGTADRCWYRCVVHWLLVGSLHVKFLELKLHTTTEYALVFEANERPRERDMEVGGKEKEKK